MWVSFNVPVQNGDARRAVADLRAGVPIDELRRA
jgi:hypothetical protein